MSSSNTVNNFPSEVGNAAEEMKHLPPGTREYKYTGNIKDMQGNIHRAFLAPLNNDKNTSTCSPFVVFSCVPQAAVDQQVNRNRDITKLVFSYDRINQVLVLHIPSRPHELAISAFASLVTRKLATMGLDLFHLGNLGASSVKTAQREKAPDMSWLPTKIPEGRSPQWPTLVLEVGYSESEAQLERDARWWLEASNGDVGIVITIDVESSKDTLLVGRWEMEAPSRPTIRNPYRGSVPQLIETVCIRQTSDSNAWEADSTITLPFEKIFLRSPAPQESDVVLTQQDLQQLGTLVWTIPEYTATY